MWKHPYAAIDEIFLNALKRNNNDVNVAFDSMHEEDMLDKELTDVNFLDSIPYLTTSALGTLQSGHLCRYRGLVQDMYGNELYVGSVMTASDRSADRKIHVTKYRDILPNEYFCDADSYNRNDSSESFKDRYAEVIRHSSLVIYIISI